MLSGTGSEAANAMKVLIIEDDADILDVVAMYLEASWPEATVFKAPNGASGLQILQREGADTVILDLGLPDVDGLDLCQHIREFSSVPIVMLTARNQTQDIVRGLEVGADDYIPKPFAQSELLARIQAILRRSREPLNQQRGVYADGELVIDFSRRAVKIRDEAIPLTPPEYALLRLLAMNAGKCLPHRMLLAEVWGVEYSDATVFLDTQVQQLLRKLHDDPQSSKYIAAESGIGYRFVA
jgi:DNA-binding response OmpR family regulator